ncbi:MAG: hypothetical protein QXX38_02155 [Candidatus Aenigmatarchaeota archaeon]
MGRLEAPTHIFSLAILELGRSGNMNIAYKKDQSEDVYELYKAKGLKASDVKKGRIEIFGTFIFAVRKIF